MKRVPKEYLSPNREMEAMANIRHWLGSGMTVENMATQLTHHYRNARPKTKWYIGRLLAAIYEYDAPETAQACADLFGIERVNNLSIGQSLYIAGHGDGAPLFFLDDYTESATSYESFVDAFSTDRWPMIVPSDSIRYVLTLSTSDSIHVIMNRDYSITIFILNKCREPILIDEEAFGDESPLYFTESSHFVSPVFKLKVVKFLLEHCLARIGFPYLTLHLSAVFTHPQAKLINREEYDEGGTNHNDWDGIDVVTLNSILPNHAFPKAYNMLTGEGLNPESVQSRMNVMLFNSLSATAILYDAVWKKGMQMNLSTRSVDRLCREKDIYKR